MDRPVLPAPHQIALDLWRIGLRLAARLAAQPAVPRRRHELGDAARLRAWARCSASLLAVAIVHSRTLDRSLLPWVIASQTVPVLAIAPIVIVILGSLGLTGVFPKAIISMYLCFFPVAVAMVQGPALAAARSSSSCCTPMRATPAHTFWKLRVPASLPFLFPSLRVGIAAGLVGAIVGELPTGAQAGLGARLLTGSYYGNTVQIWSALVMSALLGLALTGRWPRSSGWRAQGAQHERRAAWPAALGRRSPAVADVGCCGAACAGRAAPCRVRRRRRCGARSAAGLVRCGVALAAAGMACSARRARAAALGRHRPRRCCSALWVLCFWQIADAGVRRAARAAAGAAR